MKQAYPVLSPETTHDPWEQAGECWLPVVGFEGLYEVSSAGRVRSIARTCQAGYGSMRTVRSRVLTGTPDTKGYRCVSLSKNGKVSTRRICCLVAEAFLGPKPEGMILTHGAGGKDCDDLSNLSYTVRPKSSKRVMQFSPTTQAIIEASNCTGSRIVQLHIASAFEAAVDQMSLDWTPAHCMTHLRALAAELQQPVS